MMTPIRLRVVGAPQAKGSTKSFGFVRKNRHTGQPLLNRYGKPIIGTATTSANPQLKAWEEAIGKAAVLAARGRTPFEGPIEITAVFTFARPKSVKRDSPSVRPDLSKLLRGIEDPLSGVIYVDDAQVISLHGTKQYGEVPGVEITIQPAAVWASLFDRKERIS